MWPSLASPWHAVQWNSVPLAEGRAWDTVARAGVCLNCNGEVISDSSPWALPDQAAALT